MIAMFPENFGDLLFNICCKGPFSKYLRGQDEGGGGQKMSGFVRAQRIDCVHAGRGGEGSKTAKFCPRSC